MSSVLGRFVGVVGTLVLTRLLAPAVVGEVSVATVLVLSANQFSSFGFGQYVVANPKLTAGHVFQVFSLHTVFGLLGLVIILAIAGPLAPTLGAPGMAAYLPGLALSVVLNRISIIPERVLVRDMHFTMVGIARTAGEVAYVVTAVALAYLGWGGAAIVAGNVTRSLARSALILVATPRRSWLVPSKLEKEVVVDVFRFGTPLWLGASASFFAGKWDNLLISSLFGSTQLGLYNLGYNLADIPTSHVGEHIGDVLLPSFTRIDQSAQRRALLRAAGLLALIVFPLAVGLGAVSHSLVRTLFNDEWQGVAPYLTILSALSVARPIGWIIFSYLQARHRVRTVMFLEVGKLAALLAFIAILSVFGPLWSAAGVGVGYGLHAIISMWIIDRVDGVPIGRMMLSMLGPLLACVPMTGAVLLVRHGLALHSPAVGLTLEVVAGGLVYVGSCFVLARAVTQDLIHLLRHSFLRRAPEEPEPDAAAEAADGGAREVAGPSAATAPRQP